ncbi:uncharacterized protein [Nicotiana tomentosiformis]|uniref:uncharacterized protein isoform X2 n=1 Tax=Nicotiana tomentosiformis TaxID=4098 RepID=UPI00051AF1F5|nr:putative E3 ubiquitin-protein ligase RING1a isoform X2 [Nicotiana tomentosiformis]
MADLLESSSSSEPPYPYAYHYVNDILSFVEFSDSSYQAPYAYHYDFTKIGRYLIEFEDGSILSASVHPPYDLSKPTEENYFENPVQFTFSPVYYYNWYKRGGVCFNWDIDFPELGAVFNWDEDFPELKVGRAEENAEENNNVVQVFDESPERASDTSKETKPKSTGKGDKEGVEVSEEQGSFVSSSSSASLCMDRLREELSCAICLEICYEPSTTSCGHSFCEKCLRSAADICGTRCPKCRQLISNGNSCTVNTGLWNTIQLLFPKEVEARKAAGVLDGGEAEHQSSVTIASYSNISRSGTAYSARSLRRRNFLSLRRQSSVSFRTRRELPSQDDDAALAWRLQREEHVEL